MPPPKFRLVKGFGMLPQEPASLLRDETQAELDRAIARFIQARSAITAHTLGQYRRILGIYKQLGDWPPTPEGVAAFIDHYNGQDYEQNTIHTYYSILRNFIKFAHRRRLIDDDPLDEVSPPRRPGNLPRAPLSEVLDRLMVHLEAQVEQVITTKKKPYPWWGWRDVRDLALYSMMLDSGLRVTEAVNVRVTDLDLKNWVIFVNRGKGDKQREVPMGKTTHGDLKLWTEYRALVPIPPRDPGHAYLFISHRRGWQPMSSAHAEKTLTKICREAGIMPKITPHLLRHAFASLSHAYGAPVGRIQQWLGHSEMGTTARYLLTREGLRDHLKSSPRDHQ